MHAATTGTGLWAMVSFSVTSTSRAPSTHSVVTSNSRMLEPAENARPSPVSTTHRTSGAPAKAAMAAARRLLAATVSTPCGRAMMRINVTPSAGVLS